MRLNLILAIIWTLIAVPLIAVNASGMKIAGLGPTDSGLMWGILAAVLAGYNLIRWYASRAFRRSTTKPEPQSQSPKRKATHEYHPEFDFSKPGPKAIDTDEPRR